MVLGDRPLPMRRTPTGLPPHDVSAEEAVIAALLLDEESLLEVIPIVQPADFFREHNGWIYEACIALAERGESITIPTVAHELERAGRLDAAGGEPYLSDISSKYFTAIGVETHARIVARDATYRRLIAAAAQIAQLAYEGGPDLDHVLKVSGDLLAAVSDGVRNEAVLTADEVVTQALAIGVDRARPTLTTGIRALDHALSGGLGRGELTVIGAHSSVGKTALAIRMAYGQALQGLHVGYIPVEGAATKLVHRIAAIESGISLDWVAQHGWRSDDDREAYETQLEMVRALPIFFPDPVPRTPEAIEAWMRRMHRRHGLDVVYIDHVDRVNFATGRDRNLVGAYRDALTRWGNLGNEEGFAPVVLSQVNRDAPWHPSMAQLRESGAKEELSQVVLMLSMGDDDSFSPRARQMHTHKYPSQRFRERSGIALNIEVAKFTEGRTGWVTVEGSSAMYIDEMSGAAMEGGQ